ncbi:MAG: glycosyltransferase [Actinomycetota bacterium]|nr:glycosyltransferase [Actinomycetota bacterium]
MTPRARRVLLVAQLAPPSPLVAARRVAGLAKYVSRLGFEITVLTSRISGEGEIEGAAGVVRTPDLMSSRLNWRRGHFRALSGSSAATYAKPSRLQSVLVPDVAAATWVPFAVPRALALARRDRVDCVLTTGPAHSAHLVGLALRRRGVPWIAELRDGWTFDQPHRSFPLAAQRRLDAALERSVAERADALVGVTEPIAQDLRDRFGGIVEMLTNAFDPGETPAQDGDELPLDPDRFSVVHTGRLAYSGSTPRPLVEGVRLLRREHPEVAARLEVVLAGPLSAEEAALLEAEDVAGIIHPVGTLGRGPTLALQRAADALLVVTEGQIRPSVATGKLFEYLAAGPPIVVLGEGTEAARIVEEAKAGFAASATDAPAIAAAFARVVTSAPPGASSRDVERYSYPAIAGRYAQLIERVIEAKPQRRGKNSASAAATSRGR